MRGAWGASGGWGEGADGGGGGVGQGEAVGQVCLAEVLGEMSREAGQNHAGGWGGVDPLLRGRGPQRFEARATFEPAGEPLACRRKDARLGFGIGDPRRDDSLDRAQARSGAWVAWIWWTQSRTTMPSPISEV